jgi:glycosyltransferase involved in cell wall biosynthesis
MNSSVHLAFFMASLADGGIGKMRLHLTSELVKRGIQVDLLLGRTDSPYVHRIHPEVRVIHVYTSHSIAGVPRLAYYLWKRRPDVLITERVRVNVAALRAARLARLRTKVFAGVHTTMSEELAHLRPEKKRSHFAAMSRYYPRNAGLIAVSRGVARDLLETLRIPHERIHVVRNPVVTPELVRMADVQASHPWFSEDSPPVVLGAGRLEPQKDFSMLIRAFALLRRQRPSRLVILGQGGQRDQLHRLAKELGVAEEVSFPGFVDNPYAYMARSRLFVLSSAWEGSPNVLVEALAVGVPVVATDCPSGPREILQDGRYGILVPVGDVPALASAMAETLARPLAGEILRTAAEPFTVARVADEYLTALGFGAPLEARTQAGD